MRTSILIFLTLILLINDGFSKASVKGDTLKTNTVLYKVVHPDVPYVSYLFGTHHAFGKPFFDSLKNAEEALLSSEVLIKENLNIPGHLAVDVINARTKATKWKKYLGEEEYRFALNLFATSDLQFNKMTPAELFAFLSRRYKEEVCIGKDPNADYFSLDDYIASRAQDDQIAVIGLETTEDQLALINGDVRGMPRKVHKRRLSNMITRIQARSHDLCEEVDWYRNMDFDFQLDQPCRNALVLTDRNEKWMMELQDHFKTKNCFVAVGLSHLMFECGLTNQLRKLGYTIIPVQVK